MKNITLSAQEYLIEGARKVAVNNHSSLNNMFRDWLLTINNQKPEIANIEGKLNKLWDQTSFKINKKLTREEMNERR